jgi:hypothetical protein
MRTGERQSVAMIEDIQDRLDRCPTCGGEAEVRSVRGYRPEERLNLRCTKCGRLKELISPRGGDIGTAAEETWRAPDFLHL